MEEEVADEAEDDRVEGETVRRGATCHGDLERRAELRDDCRNNAANKAVNKLVRHGRTDDEEENCKEERVHDFLGEHVYLIKKKKSFGCGL